MTDTINRIENRSMAALDRRVFDEAPPDSLLAFACRGAPWTHPAMTFYVPKAGVILIYDTGVSCPTCDALAEATGQIVTLHAPVEESGASQEDARRDDPTGVVS